MVDSYDKKTLRDWIEQHIPQARPKFDSHALFALESIWNLLNFLNFILRLRWTALAWQPPQGAKTTQGLYFIFQRYLRPYFFVKFHSLKQQNLMSSIPIIGFINSIIDYSFIDRQLSFFWKYIEIIRISPYFIYQKWWSTYFQVITQPLNHSSTDGIAEQNKTYILLKLYHLAINLSVVLCPDCLFCVLGWGCAPDQKIKSIGDKMWFYQISHAQEWDCMRYPLIIYKYKPAASAVYH